MAEVLTVDFVDPMHVVVRYLREKFLGQDNNN